MPEPVILGVGPSDEPVLLTPEERSTHLHVLGATGQGKSKFLEHLITQDIEHRHGVCLLDPHGSLYQTIVAWCAAHGLHRNSRRRVHLIDPNDSRWTVGFDPLRCKDPDLLAVVVDGAVDACAQVWGGEDVNRTPLLKKCLRAVFYALAAGGHSLADALALINVNDIDGFRAKVTGAIDDEVFRIIWDDLNSLSRREFTETFSSTQNRLMEFLANPALRRMLRLKGAALDIPACLENGDIVLVNLQPRAISNDNARLLGTLLTNVLFNSAIRRDERRARHRPFYLYIDECYRFLTSDVEAMLDQTRKFGLHVTLAHQHLGQLRKYGDHIFNAVMTNARTKVVFGGLADGDGEQIAREILRDTFDYNRAKDILSKPTVVGYERIQLTARGRAEGYSQTEGESSGFSDMSGSMSGTGMTQVFDEHGQPLTQVYTGSETSGVSTGSSRAYGSMRARTESIVESESIGEALMPILEDRPTALVGHEEIMHRAILATRKLPKRAFLLAQPGQPTRLLVTPEMEEPMVSTRRLEAFVEGAKTNSPFMLLRLEIEARVAPPIPGAAVVDEVEADPFSVPEE